MLIGFQSFAQITGKISGRVIDLKTQLPLIGANVFLEGTSLGGQTDEQGYYVINNIPTKTYSIKAQFIGYKEVIKFDVLVTSGNTLNFNFELEEKVVDLKEVTVTASPFQKTKESPMSVQTLSQQEIKSYPGGNNDIAKVVQALPGVSGSVGFRNDVIIRGGAPNENVYYLDGVEIPNINHFATQGSAGGPVGLLNVTFIEDVTLSTSAFNAKYDNVLSGILQFKQRTGNKDRIQGNARFGASEAGLTMEGPFKKGSDKATFIASIRRSYLQYLFKAIGLPFLPDYYDYQFKFNFKLSPKTELNFIGVGAIDKFRLNKGTLTAKDTASILILDQLPLYDQYSSNTGLSLKHLLKNGQLNVVLSYNHLKNQIRKWDDNDESKTQSLNYLSRETEFKFRASIEQYIGKYKINYGLNAIQSVYTNNSNIRLFGEVKDSLGNIIKPAVKVNYSTNINFIRYGLFGQVSRSFFKDAVSVSAGLRADGNNWMNDGNNLAKTLSPRLALSYNFLPRWNINVSAGKYYKILPYTLLGYKENNQFVNKDAQYIGNIHYTAGFEYLPEKATRITVEGFYKLYDHYPVSVRDSISLANLGGNFGVLGNEATKSVGLGRTYGVEFFFQQKFSHNFYAVFSYTAYRSEYTGFGSKYIPSAWDNKHLISLTGGYRFKYGFEVGTRFRYLGGQPYTPTNIEASMQQYPSIGQGLLDFRQFNSLRLGGFGQWDIRIDKKFNTKKLSIDAYIDIQNVLSAIQPEPKTFTLFKNPDGTFKTTDGKPVNGQNVIPQLINTATGSILPTFGFIVEF